jgi:hypothetical protein
MERDEMERKLPKRRGPSASRPSVPDQKTTISVRVSGTLKDQLVAATAKNDRSQSQEAEIRLEMSFREEAFAERALELRYGPRLAAVLTMIGDLMHQTGRIIGFQVSGTLEGADNWVEDPTAFDAAGQAAIVALAGVAPAGDVKYPKIGTPPGIGVDLDQALTQTGASFALGLLQAIADPDSAVSSGALEKASELRPRLGSLANGIPSDRSKLIAKVMRKMEAK